MILVLVFNKLKDDCILFIIMLCLDIYLINWDIEILWNGSI
jgi:hypothetical protein